MTPRKKRRILLISTGFVLLAVSAAAIGFGMRDSIEFFKSPTQIVEEGPPNSRSYRIGGLVEDGSLEHGEGQNVAFMVTDGANSIEVNYDGLLPDLFREGQGVVARGKMEGDVFVANEILAKHDEKYMPREVIDALKEQGVYEEPETE